MKIATQQNTFLYCHQARKVACCPMLPHWLVLTPYMFGAWIRLELSNVMCIIHRMQWLWFKALGITFQDQIKTPGKYTISAQLFYVCCLHCIVNLHCLLPFDVHIYESITPTRTHVPILPLPGAWLKVLFANRSYSQKGSREESCTQSWVFRTTQIALLH